MLRKNYTVPQTTSFELPIPKLQPQYTPMTDMPQLFGLEAQVRYFPARFEILTAGDYVRCAITDYPVALQDLRYWSVARQEAYVDADAALQAHQRAAKPTAAKPTAGT